MMVEQFVTGQTIDKALQDARRLKARVPLLLRTMLAEAASAADDG